MTRLSRVIGAAAIVLVGAGVVAVGTKDDDEVAGPPAVERVLVVSLPGVAWTDVQRGSLPSLRTFVGEAAIGDVSTRIGKRRASSTDAYLTIGAGTRALAPRVDVAVALDPDEVYAGVRTADILERRLGEVPTGIAYLPVGAAIDVNDRSVYGAEPGLLGDELAAGGVDRAVIANADAAEGFVSDEPPPDGAYARGAATALMGSDGIVPGGTVGRGLLREDPDAPFGRRLDLDQVLRAFDTEWSGSARGVVLVEASDLARSRAYGPRAAGAQRTALRTEALADSDELLARLLERVDPATDAVLVLSPVAARTSPELGVAALRAPGLDAGYLRSSTTRRDGYVQLADVAPTVLELLGLDAPDSIEGRPFEVGDSGSADRVGRLVEQADAAEFRDDLMPLIVPLVIAWLAVVLGAALLAERLPRWVGRLVPPAAFAALGVVPATYVVGQVDAARGSTPTFLLSVAAVAAAIGAVLALVERRRPGLGTIAMLGAIAVLFVGDVLLGARLQVNTVFGYSVAVAGRFTGLGNLAFALFAATSLLLGVLLVDRLGNRGLRPALLVLAIAFLVEGLPTLGADVGGVLAMVPAFGVAALLLAGRAPRWRHLVGLGVLGGLAVLGFAFLDQLRPDGEQTHLARLAEHVTDGRWSTFWDTLERRLEASFGSVEVGLWGLVLVALLLASAYSVLVGVDRWSRLLDARPRHAPTVAALAGLGLLAALGLVTNDSSIAVPTTMLIIATPVAVLRFLVPQPGLAR